MEVVDHHRILRGHSEPFACDLEDPTRWLAYPDLSGDDDDIRELTELEARIGISSECVGHQGNRNRRGAQSAQHGDRLVVTLESMLHPRGESVGRHGHAVCPESGGETLVEGLGVDPSCFMICEQRAGLLVVSE